MANSDVDALITKVLASETFNTSDGRTLQEQIRKRLLAGLPRSIPPATAGMLYARIMREAPYTLWMVIHKTRRQHAPPLMVELRRHRSLTSDFLVAATFAGTRSFDDETYARLIRAATALVKIRSFVHSAISRASSLRVAFIARDAALVAAIRAAITPLIDTEQHGDDLGVWLWFISVLAQDASPASLKVLARLAEVAEKHDDVSVLARLLGYHSAENAGLARIVAKLCAQIDAKIEAAGSSQFARGLKLAKRDWWIEVVAGTDPSRPIGSQLPYPLAMLRANAGTEPPTWEARVQTLDDYSLLSDQKDRHNGFALAAPTDLLRIGGWFDDAATKLGLQWAWSRVRIKTNLQGDERARLTAWAKKHHLRQESSK
jgi:hypothetical protein